MMNDISCCRFLKKILELGFPKHPETRSPKTTMSPVTPLPTVALLVLVSLFAASCQPKNGRTNRKASVGRHGSAQSVPAPQFAGPLGRASSYNGISTSQPIMALTFDDGPHPANTPRLLDMLRSFNVKATFFVTGDNARRYPDILRRMVAEGHEIGNHTMTHVKLTTISPSQVREEIIATQQAVKSATGLYPRSFRPPYGATNDQLKNWIKGEFGLPSIMWSVDPEDWKKPGVGVVTSRLVNGANPGGILLLHDIHSTSVDAVPATLDQLKRRGMQFVTISQLIARES